MRRVLIAAGITTMLTAVPVAAHAQTTPPTTIETETSTKEVTVTSQDVKTVDTDDDDDSDKTGLWGLAGLLGLAGLAGLKRKKDDTPTRGTSPGTYPTGSSTGASTPGAGPGQPTSGSKN